MQFLLCCLLIDPYSGSYERYCTAKLIFRTFMFGDILDIINNSLEMSPLPISNGQQKHCSASNCQVKKVKIEADLIRNLLFSSDSKG